MVFGPQNQRLNIILPYILLSALLGCVFMIQAGIIGFDLGYWEDILKVRAIFQQLGTRGAIEFFAFENLRRHIFSVLQHASIHIVSPNNSAIWYSSTVFTHYLAALSLLLLSDTILRYRHRWLSFGIALFFAFYARHFIEFFEFSTRAFIHVSLVTQLLSFWFFLQYVRLKRRNHWWRDWSILLYAVTLNLYETSSLYVVLYPVLAYLADRENGAVESWWKWLVQIIKDGFWYGFILLFYLSMLMIYLSSEQIDVSFGAIVSRMFNTLAVEFSLAEIIARLQPSLDGGWIMLTLVAAIVTALAGGWAHRTAQHDELVADSTDNLSTNLQIVVLIMLGIGMCVLNLFVAVQVSLLPPPFSVRTMYPFVAGLAFVLFGGLFFLLRLIPSKLGQATVFALVISLSVAPSLTRLLQIQSDYAERNASRNQILDAIYEAVPDLPRRATPYFMVFTDEASNEAIYDALRANDFNLPRLFLIDYGTRDFGFDLVRYDLPEADTTDEDTLREGSPYVIAAEEGIYSTLRVAPIGTIYEPNPPEDLIILYYDGETGVAEILGEAPPELLQMANIIELVPTNWQTNYDLLPE